jgi:hypothetical protein
MGSIYTADILWKIKIILCVDICNRNIEYQNPIYHGFGLLHALKRSIYVYNAQNTHKPVCANRRRVYDTRARDTVRQIVDR